MAFAAVRTLVGIVFLERRFQSVVRHLSVRARIGVRRRRVSSLISSASNPHGRSRRIQARNFVYGMAGVWMVVAILVNTGVLSSEVAEYYYRRSVGMGSAQRHLFDR